MFIIYKENTRGSVRSRRGASARMPPVFHQKTTPNSLTFDLCSWKPLQTHNKTKKKTEKKQENSSYESNQALTERGRSHTAVCRVTKTTEVEGYSVFMFNMTPPPHCPGSLGRSARSTGWLICQSRDKAGSWSMLSAAVDACSVEVEPFLHGGSKQTLPHDVLGGIFRKLQVMNTRVD